jgi:hypothetical protein
MSTTAFHERSGDELDGWLRNVSAGLAGQSTATLQKTYRSPGFICDPERMAYQEPQQVLPESRFLSTCKEKPLGETSDILTAQIPKFKASQTSNQ